MQKLQEDRAFLQSLLQQTLKEELNEQIAHLKDQLQEWKAKTGLEANYVKKERQAMEEEVSTLKQKIEEEKKVMMPLDTPELRSWMDKWITGLAAYEQDLEMKTSDVQEIKTLKAAGLQRYNELATKYKEYEDVVVEHQSYEGENQRIKAEQDMREGRLPLSCKHGGKE
eukprot:Em0343g1a